MKRLDKLNVIAKEHSTRMPAKDESPKEEKSEKAEKQVYDEDMGKLPGDAAKFSIEGLKAHICPDCHLKISGAMGSHKEAREE